MQGKRAENEERVQEKTKVVSVEAFSNHRSVWRVREREEREGEGEGRRGGNIESFTILFKIIM